jgi:hypothetical protein
VLRQRAKDCRARAEAAGDAVVKKHFLEMAKSWERLAKEAETFSATPTQKKPDDK